MKVITRANLPDSQRVMLRLMKLEFALQTAFRIRGHGPKVRADILKLVRYIRHDRHLFGNMLRPWLS